ncbi:osmotically-inducible lipoprotein OsmE [Pseudomonas seleniipraecipitans]|jgi:osmotically inducible lipoprotein OsmE|uniref:Beta-barrel assembly machine subunit BamE n=1 Tax=Phytopseudomonas seleniipraecipitans TaxID=640205 RepID=A0A1G7KET8_9GAMM|nr:osmotically-inducible lipoprotein OsmE [Pseudomonas seleniipraecipitans]NQD80694.1 osmotically-inducible lipoprotein OsmE [Pseudomonas sp. CrR14]UUD65521.1 osmotically-inducible lipoprotein OsmE [Pseudomonas seleniipraecipitans]SDF35359.1 Beta-barrel assembly machine subunit BamE [Pseudomonas seleniipraecipitans]
MFKQTLGAAAVLAVLTGCAGTPENPVDHITYRNEPLVKQVEKDMSKSTVLELGGPPSSEMARTVHPGSCNNYVLNRDGKEQPYYVAFNSADRVDSKGFMSCEQMEINERERARGHGI